MSDPRTEHEWRDRDGLKWEANVVGTFCDGHAIASYNAVKDELLRLSQENKQLRAVVEAIYRKCCQDAFAPLIGETCREIARKALEARSLLADVEAETQ